MSQAIKTRARGLYTHKEFSVFDSLVFPQAALQAAFLLEDPKCKKWVANGMAALRGSRDKQELQVHMMALRRQAANYDVDGRILMRDETPAKARARAREASLRAEAEARGAKGQPSMFDRRSGAWVDAGFWAPVPFVDGPAGQDFTHGVWL